MKLLPWLLVFMLGGAALAAAPAPAEPAPQAEPRAPAHDPHDARLPVGAIRAFIDAARARRYAAAAEQLDLSSLPADERARAETLAWRLEVVLDRKLWVHYEKMSAEPEGKLDDGLPPNLERLEGESTELEILLARVEGPHGKVWKVAPSSVERIDDLYATYGYGWLGDRLPPVLFEYEFAGVEAWQWIGFAVIALAAGVLAWIVVGLGVRLLRPLAARTATDLDDRLLQWIRPPVRLLAWLGLFAAGTLQLELSIGTQAVVRGIESALIVVALTWLAIRAVDVVATVTIEHLVRQGRRSAVSVVPLGSRTAKFVLLAVALVAALHDLGVNVTGLVAGLSIGGLAVGLAAQKSIANLFGGVSLAMDQPIRVGDLCRFGEGKQGTVEEIGLRSTRIRTLDRTLVTIPNAEFSEIQLENFAARDKMRLLAVLGLRYETRPAEMRQVIAALRELVASHPMVEQDTAQVRFVAFGTYSLDVELSAYVKTADPASFFEVREELFLRTMELVEAAGTSFAFPSQTLYLGRDHGAGAERVPKAEARA